VIKFNRTLNNSISMAGKRNIDIEVEKGKQGAANVPNVIGSAGTALNSPTRRLMSPEHRQNLSRSMKEWARKRKTQAGQ